MPHGSRHDQSRQLSEAVMSGGESAAPIHALLGVVLIAQTQISCKKVIQMQYKFSYGRARRAVFAVSLVILLGLSASLKFRGLAESQSHSQLRRVALKTTDPSPLSVPEAEEPAHLREAYGRLPMSFEANAGQADGKVKFLSRGEGYNLFLTDTEAIFALEGRVASTAHTPSRKGRKAATHGRRRGAVVRVKPVGTTDGAVRVKGYGELPGKSNYFIGNEAARSPTPPSSDRAAPTTSRSTRRLTPISPALPSPTFSPPRPAPSRPLVRAAT